MDINKGKLVYIKNKSSYNSNVFLDTLVIFVEDTKEIITHGISFAGIPSSYNMYVGAKDKKANASTTNGNTYIKLYKDSTLSNQFNIKGTGATTVVSDASGNITIDSTDNNTWRALQVKGTQIAGTGTNTYPINFAEGTDITLNGTAGTSTTKLNSITINHASISTTVTAAKDTATLLAYSGEITVPTAITTNNGHITAYTWTKYKLPAASHYTTHIYAGASGATANSTSEVSNPYLTVVDNTTYRDQVQFKGGGKTTVKANGGIITISSTDTWNAFVGATSSKAGTAGYVPAPNSGQTGLYFRSDGTWATPPGTYSLPTASNTTLGGVKTGSAITDISGYTAVKVKDGVIYYKDTTYSTKDLKINNNTYKVYTSSSSLPIIYAPTGVGTAGQVLATNDNADGLTWKSVATNTKAMNINGNNYSIYTTATSLPTMYVPTSLGSAGQVLKVNSDGTGLIWDTDATIANTWRPVQALKSDGTSLGTLSNNTSTVKFKAGSNITLAYSSGTITITGVGNTWTALGGATASADGTAGYAPKPTKGQQGYYLKGNATWVKPSLSEFTDDVVSGNYLLLSGGTITSSGITPLLVKSTSSGKSVTIRLSNSDRTVADFGHTSSDGVFIQDFVSGYYIGVKTDGTPYYYNGSFRTILHESNYSSYALPLTGGEMTGVLTFKNFGGQPLVGKKGNNIVFTLGSGSSDTTAGSEYGILLLFHSGSEKIRLYANPNYKSWMDVYRLGIGTSNPEYKLHVVGDTYINGKLLTKALDIGIDGISSNDTYIEGKGTNSLRIQYYKTSTTWDLLKLQGGGLYFNDNLVYHVGNLKTIWGLSITNGVVSGNLHLGTGSDYEIGSGYASSDTIRYNKIIYGCSETGLQFNSGLWTTKNNLVTHKFCTYHCTTNPALYILNNGDVRVSNTFYSDLIRSKTNDIWMVGYDISDKIVSLGSSSDAATDINGQESVRIASWRNSNMITVLDLNYNGVHSNSAFKVYDTSDYQYIQVGPPTSNHAVFDNHSNLGRGASIAACNSSLLTLGVIGINSLGKPFYTNGLGSSYDLIHSGNIGSYSSGSSQTSSNINGVLYFNNSSYVGEGSQGNHNVAMFTYEDLYLYCRYGHNGGSPYIRYYAPETNSAALLFGGKTHTEFKNSIGNTQLHISQSFTILGYTNPQNGLDTYIDGTQVHIRYGANHAYEATFCSDSYVNVPALKIGGQALTFVT